MKSKSLTKLCAAALVAAVVLSVGCSHVEIEPSVVQAQITPQTSVATYSNALPIPNAQVLFNKNINLLGGWNHVANFPDEFAGLKFPSGMYRIDRKPALNHGEHQYSTTLIKKYGDWNHQHANGITAHYPVQPFANIAGIEMVVRINTDISNLPSPQDIAKTYGELVTEAQLEALDDGNVHLSIALVGDGADNTAIPTFNAEYMLSLDAKKQTDDWYHVFIPAAELTRYIEVNYNKTPVTAAESKTIPVNSFRLTAETSSTKVIRNILLDNFNENTPKLFKEVGLEVKYVSVVRRGQ